MPWKLEITAQLPHRQRAEEQKRGSSHNVGAFLVLLAALLAVAHGRRGPAIASLPDDLNFGALALQSAGGEQTLVIRNQGSAALNLRHAVIAGEHSADYR